jgi:hypothetical protein
MHEGEYITRHCTPTLNTDGGVVLLLRNKLQEIIHAVSARRHSLKQKHLYQVERSTEQVGVSYQEGLGSILSVLLLLFLFLSFLLFPLFQLTVYYYNN